MAASGFGLSSLQMKCFDCSSAAPKLIALGSYRLRTSKPVLDGLTVSCASKKPWIVCRSLLSEAICNSTITELEENSLDFISSENAVTTPTTTTTTRFTNVDEVESLLTVLCDTTSIAEVKLECGGFQLHVVRNLVDQSASVVPAPVAVETFDLNGSATSTSLALSPIPSSDETLRDKASEEGLEMLKSPKVGYFRRSRAIKGRRTPPSCKEKDFVKEGQVLCYIDQLGGEIPIESDVSGEVVRILRDDGDPVGYGDELIAVRPSFPGVKQLLIQ